ncbi:MAG TPA: hypothetical protein VHB50_01565, partial [Bryobacteraceae bacterium]|nr:hypothetical protein [Bryobacteraceae bacterium]
MNISAEDFRQHFALLSDEALLATRRDDLTDVAKACYDDEVAHRELSPDAAEEDTQEAEIQEERSEEDQANEHGKDMVSLTSFPDVEEARLARGLLQIAGIPSFL